MAPPPEVPRLYAIADARALAPVRLGTAVERLLAAGVEWIQLRAKSLPDDAFEAEAESAARLARARGAILWINDRPDIAAVCDAGGLHLGQGDIAPRDARAIVGSRVLIGLSTHTQSQIEVAARDPAVDVLAIGPIFATASKPGANPVVGLELVTWARRLTQKPLVAIGGIDADSAPSVLAAGADSVAVIGALGRDDLTANARALLAAVRP